MLKAEKMKIRVNVFISNVSAERFLEIKRPLPKININTNLNILGVDKSHEKSLEVPFVFTITYNPSVAQISLKGKAHVVGDREELEKMHKAHKEQKVSPIIMQTISNVVFIESVMISRTLHIPPPIPLPKVPLATGKKQGPEPRYRA
ncbi:MAG: hypothetical protein JSW72_03690 [Candidatus Bathyarchaeota archaeon]|nr:MAG: hypothetical protein JSW72_03690 [Candidatus Bathyarchaeota archaeon]